MMEMNEMLNGILTGVGDTLIPDIRALLIAPYCIMMPGMGTGVAGSKNAPLI